ncbi:hypothetical protein PF001_g25985 [Phytophthora fragariae]|uniref:Uncharacterized protein n=1 Tax=Phytophthora fragariae TaxID=53985 RepID=A0A6A3S137_9STRA|nr:hypothetical protein PF009_g27264 [Phytophthora fragariae]KAE9104397.1 hypothetical protein PF006_g21909 [Phytophthora fragariae]KAE9198982.1 hypothetical protein PF004_g19403 [Phytophthora fragariae]KAE9276742.1 hypothetical protein PF001_g25985 [Phytophthora fragariae]
MAAVSPTPAIVPVRRSVRIFRAVVRWVRRLAGRLPGEFTIAKLDAYNRFQEQATVAQFATALLLTPVPCLISNLLIECIPLADPATGFKYSLHFQIRHLVAGMMVAIMPVFVKFDCIPDLPVRSWKFALGYGLALGSAGIGFNAVISVLGGVFPVPFAQFTPSLPLPIIGGTLNHLFLQTTDTKGRAEKIDQWASIDAVPIFVYPLFTAVFMTLKPSQQLWFSLLLPVVKQLLREMIWFVFRDDLDLVGSTTCTIGHFYHVLFTAMCLQNAKSLETLTAIASVNTLQMLLNCREIIKDADALDRSRQQFAEFTVIAKADIVSAALKFAEDTHVARRLHWKKPSRIFSKYRGYQGADFVDRYQALLASNETASIPHEHGSQHSSQQNNKRRSLLSAKSLPKPIQPGFTKVAPFSDSLLTNTSTESRSGLSSSAPVPVDATLPSIQPRTDLSYQKEVFVHHVTSALNQTEIILLRSYITINALVFYGIYLLVVFQLPNRKFFATMTTMTTVTAVASMIRHLLLLGSLELIFLALYLMLISCRLGVSGVRQLAFVLWSQRILLQSKFLTLTLMILGFPLEHYGNGIIFRLRSG